MAFLHTLICIHTVCVSSKQCYPIHKRCYDGIFKCTTFHATSISIRSKLSIARNPKRFDNWGSFQLCKKICSTKLTFDCQNKPLMIFDQNFRIWPIFRSSWLSNQILSYTEKRLRRLMLMANSNKVIEITITRLLFGKIPSICITIVANLKLFVFYLGKPLTWPCKILSFMIFSRFLIAKFIEHFSVFV